MNTEQQDEQRPKHRAAGADTALPPSVHIQCEAGCSLAPGAQGVSWQGMTCVWFPLDDAPGYSWVTVWFLTMMFTSHFTSINRLVEWCNWNWENPKLWSIREHRGVRM